jgi:uncharacterized protein GlcG (DUF336 family)
MAMSLSEAIGYVDRGLQLAKEKGLLVSFAVVDDTGQLVQLDRMDGAALMSPDVATAKALTALNFKRPTSEVAKLDATVLKALTEVVNFKVLPVAGGIPLMEGATLKGAIGVSGATSQDDEALARHAAGV